MCGRYYIHLNEPELMDIARRIEQAWSTPDLPMKIKTSGEIFPSDIVPVQTGIDQFEPMKWGFKGFNSRPIINARSETALEKPMFRDAMRDRRCLIPASGYFEWEKIGDRKVKNAFYLPNKPIFLAGCYRKEQDSPVFTFVILTREATPELEHIHDRMPVIIPHTFRRYWLENNAEPMNYSVLDLRFSPAD